MANLGIYIELKDNKIKKSIKEAVSLAQKSGKETYAIIFTNTPDQFKDELKGVSKVIQVKGDDLTYQPDYYAETIAKIIKEHQLEDFIGIFSAQGKDLFPRISAKIDNASLINDCVDLDFENGTVTKPVYAGKLLSTQKIEDDIRMYTIRPNVFPVDPPKDSEPEIIPFEMITDIQRFKIIEIIKSVSKKIDLTEAEIIVSGGRGMKSKENFVILEELAAVLNSGVGASRAAVDSEYASSDMQVGQTGKVVNPKLYIACGISGAIQHFVGMKTSKIIVAINKDSEAPIFKKADYGIVGDLFKIVPLLKEELKKVL
jgi:electron transfer flavoprotein alpha subunit